MSGEGRRDTNWRETKIGAGGEEGAGSRRCAPCPAAWHCTLPTPTPGEPAWRAGRVQGSQARKAPHPWPRGQRDTGHTENAKGQGIKQDKTK